MARRQDRKLKATASEEGIVADEERIGRLARDRCEGSFDLPASAGLEHPNLQAEGGRGFR